MRKENRVIGFASALAVVLGVLCGLNGVAFAGDSAQCTQVYLNGKMTSACFNLSEEQIQDLNVKMDPSAAPQGNGVEADCCRPICIKDDIYARCIEWAGCEGLQQC